MTYDELLIKQKSLLDRSRICLNNGDYSSFNKIMEDFNKLSDSYLNERKSNNKQKKIVYEIEIVFKKGFSKKEYFSTLENALNRKDDIINGNSSYNLKKIIDVYVNDEPILKSFYSF